jgi:hypothetical protein
MIRILVALVAFAWAVPASAEGVKYLVKVRGVLESPGVTSGFVDEARALFLEELKKHPELTLEWPAGLPEEGEPLKQALKAKKLRAFEMTLKILDVKRGIHPPPAGKQYRVITRGIKLAVFGDTIPDHVMAIGGDGESTLSAEIGKAANEEKEGKSLLADATKAAVAQAVDMTVSKLNLADKPAKKK